MRNVTSFGRGIKEKLTYYYVYFRSMYAMRRESRAALQQYRDRLDPQNMEHQLLWVAVVWEAADVVGDLEAQRHMDGKRPMSYRQNRYVVRFTIHKLMDRALL